MGRYNLISIGGVYLTTDGTATGDKCRSNVTGLDALNLDYSGNTFTALDGTPYVQVIANRSRGEVVEVDIEQLGKSVFEQIVGVLNGATASSAGVAMKVVGDLGSFYLTVLPNYPNPLEVSGEFIEERIRSVKLRFIVKHRNRLMVASPGSYALTGTSANLVVTIP